MVGDPHREALVDPVAGVDRRVAQHQRDREQDHQAESHPQACRSGQAHAQALDGNSGGVHDPLPHAATTRQSALRASVRSPRRSPNGASVGNAGAWRVVWTRNTTPGRSAARPTSEMWRLRCQATAGTRYAPVTGWPQARRRAAPPARSTSGPSCASSRACQLVARIVTRAGSSHGLTNSQPKTSVAARAAHLLRSSPRAPRAMPAAATTIASAAGTIRYRVLPE